RARVHRPEEAPLLAEREFEEHRLAVEQALDLGARGERRLSERRVARATAADLGFHLGELFERREGLRLRGPGALVRGGALQQAGLADGFAIQPQEQGSLAVAQARIDIRADVGAGLLEKVEQRTGASSLAGFESLPRMPPARLAAVELHQQVDLH